VRAEGERARHSTLTTFITQRYEPWALTYLKSGEFQVERIQADFADWMAKPLVDINSWLIEGWRKRQLAAGLAPSTIGLELQNKCAVSIHQAGPASCTRGALAPPSYRALTNFPRRHRRQQNRLPDRRTCHVCHRTESWVAVR
jgi:hypothetical protein